MMKTLIILDRAEQIPRVKKRLRNNLIITFSPEIQKELQETGLKYKTREDYLDKKSNENIGRETILLVREWGRLKTNGETLKEFLTHGDLPFWDIIESSFADRLFEHSEKPQYVKLMTKIIQTEKPDKIVSGDTTIPGRAAICIAKNLGIEVEKIGSGITGSLKYYYQTRLKNHLFRYANRVKELERALSTRKIKKWFKGGKKKILIIPTIGTETSVVAPVIRELEKNGNYELLTLRIGSLREQMKKSLGGAGIKNTPVEAFVNKDVRKRASNAIKFLKERWKILNAKEEFKNSLKYEGIPVWDLVKEDFEFYFSTRAKVIEIAKYVETIREILDKERPDIILSLDELSEIGKPMSLLARKRKIPLVIIQHGLFGKDIFIYGPSLATKKCVWGPYTRELLLKRWFTEEQLVVTGCPKFDNIIKTRKVDKESVYRELRIDRNKDIVLFASQPTGDAMEFAPTLLKGMKEFPDKQLVIKLHPREYTESFYRNLAEKIGIKVNVVKDFDLHELLRKSEVVITTFSTVDLEAIMMNKPLIRVNLLGKPESMTYDAKDVALDVFKKEDFPQKLKEALDREKAKTFEKNRDKFLYQYSYKQDGKATDRVVALLNKLVNRHHE